MKVKIISSYKQQIIYSFMSWIFIKFIFYARKIAMCSENYSVNI